MIGYDFYSVLMMILRGHCDLLGFHPIIKDVNQPIRETNLRNKNFVGVGPVHNVDIDKKSRNYNVGAVFAKVV